jgi:hypothetical protein
MFQEDEFTTNADLFSEFNKLNILNHQLQTGSISSSDKVLLIYEKILSELTDGCEKNGQI